MLQMITKGLQDQAELSGKGDSLGIVQAIEIWTYYKIVYACPVGWGCRIHQLHLHRGVRTLLNECPEYGS